MERRLGLKGENKSYEQLKEQMMGVLRMHFRPEFLNRIDAVIVFHALTQEQIKLIAKLQLDRVKQTARGQGIELSFDDSLIDHLAKVGFVPEYGARELRRRIQAEVETKLAKEMLSGTVKEGDSVRLSHNPKSGLRIEKGTIGEKPKTAEKRRRGKAA